MASFWLKIAGTVVVAVGGILKLVGELADKKDKK